MKPIDQVRKMSDVVTDLAWPFGLNLNRANPDDAWFTLSPSTTFTVVAGEGSGGVFAAFGSGDLDDRPILYVSSEGQAGRIASTLEQAVALVLSLPYWQTVLKFSGSGNLAQMRRVLPWMQTEYTEDFPGIWEKRDQLAVALGVQLLPDPIALLHDSVHATKVEVLAPDGSACESLFNSFTVDDRR